jgi:hypothetical protein
VNCQGTEEGKPKKVCPEQGHSLPDMDGRRIAQAERTFVEKWACCSSDFLAIRMAINGASHGRRTIPEDDSHRGTTYTDENSLSQQVQDSTPVSTKVHSICLLRPLPRPSKVPAIVSHSRPTLICARQLTSDQIDIRS